MRRLSLLQVEQDEITNIYWGLKCLPSTYISCLSPQNNTMRYVVLGAQEGYLDHSELVSDELGLWPNLDS
jgi:hypothetical protein